MFALALRHLEQQSCDCELVAVVCLLSGKIDEGIESAGSWASPNTQAVPRGGSVVKVEGEAVDGVVESSWVAAREGGLKGVGDRLGRKGGSIVDDEGGFLEEEIADGSFAAFVVGGMGLETWKAVCCGDWCVGIAVIFARDLGGGKDSSEKT